MWWGHTLFEAQPITVSWNSEFLGKLHNILPHSFNIPTSGPFSGPLGPLAGTDQQVPSHIVVGPNVLCKSFNSVLRSSRDFSSLILSLVNQPVFFLIAHARAEGGGGREGLVHETT